MTCTRCGAATELTGRECVWRQRCHAVGISLQRVCPSCRHLQRERRRWPWEPGSWQALLAEGFVKARMRKARRVADAGSSSGRRA